MIQSITFIHQSYYQTEDIINAMESWYNNVINVI